MRRSSCRRERFKAQSPPTKATLNKVAPRRAALTPPLRPRGQTGQDAGNPRVHKRRSHVCPSFPCPPFPSPAFTLSPPQGPDRPDLLQQASPAPGPHPASAPCAFSDWPSAPQRASPCAAPERSSCRSWRKHGAARAPVNGRVARPRRLWQEPQPSKIMLP
jgi:hypothetical protein